MLTPNVVKLATYLLASMLSPILTFLGGMWRVLNPFMPPWVPPISQSVYRPTSRSPACCVLQPLDVAVPRSPYSQDAGRDDRRGRQVFLRSYLARRGRGSTQDGRRARGTVSVEGKHHEGRQLRPVDMPPRQVGYVQCFFCRTLYPVIFSRQNAAGTHLCGSWFHVKIKLS